MKITAEHLAGLRELQASLPPGGGLRPVEIPREVLNLLVEHTFALAKLQDATQELINELPLETRPCINRRHEPRMVLATKVCRFRPPYVGVWFGCDECAANPPKDLLLTAETEDLRYAPALRLVLKLLGGQS